MQPACSLQAAYDRMQDAYIHDACRLDASLVGPRLMTDFTSGLDDRHIYFRYNATSGCVDDNVVEPDNIGHGCRRWNLVSSCPVS